MVSDSIADGDVGGIGLAGLLCAVLVPERPGGAPDGALPLLTPLLHTAARKRLPRLEAAPSPCAPEISFHPPL